MVGIFAWTSSLLSRDFNKHCCAAFLGGMYVYELYGQILKNIATFFLHIYDKNEFKKVSRHSSEIRGLFLMKCPSEMLQNLSYFWNMKTQIIFFIFHFILYFIFSLMNALVYVDIDQGTH